MEREEFWVAAYLAQLNNSNEPMAHDRSNQATKTADIAVIDYDDFHNSPTSTEME